MMFLHSIRIKMHYTLHYNIDALLSCKNVLTIGVPPMQSIIESQILGFVIGPSPYVVFSLNILDKVEVISLMIDILDSD